MYSVYENVTNVSIPITGNVESLNITDLCKLHAKQKHLGYKNVQGQSEATCKQAGATKDSDIS